MNIWGGCASTSTASAKTAVCFHVLQALQLLALQVWACAQYAQAYCLLLGATCSMLQLLRAGRGALPGQRTVSGNIAARCARSGAKICMVILHISSAWLLLCGLQCYFAEKGAFGNSVIKMQFGMQM